MSNLIHTPGRLQRSLVAEDGITRIEIGAGEPPVSYSNPDAHLLVALTPTATHVLFAIDGPVDITGASVRFSSQVGLGTPSPSDLRHLRVWARRRPGTTGAIATQIIRFGKGDDTALAFEIGRISVLAEAAGTTDPIGDVFDQPYCAGHPEWAIGTSLSFRIDLTEVDPDLELIIEMHWNKP